MEEERKDPYSHYKELDFTKTKFVPPKISMSIFSVEGLMGIIIKPFFIVQYVQL
jgi:hypothetical protein